MFQTKPFLFYFILFIYLLAFSPKHLTVCYHTPVTISNNSRNEGLHHYFIHFVMNVGSWDLFSLMSDMGQIQRWMWTVSHIQPRYEHRSTGSNNIINCCNQGSPVHVRPSWYGLLGQLTRMAIVNVSTGTVNLPHWFSYLHLKEVIQLWVDSMTCGFLVFINGKCPQGGTVLKLSRPEAR